MRAPRSPYCRGAPTGAGCAGDLAKTPSRTSPDATGDCIDNAATRGQRIESCVAELQSIDAIRVAAGADLGLVNIGTQLSASDDLAPGSAFEHVELLFWIDSAPLYPASGRTFDLWYGRIVSNGVFHQFEA